MLPTALTGVESPIIVAFGDRFPMIGAHKVLAAYACLAPRVVTGQFDPTRHRAIWPSTGNYARGGVAISRIMGCRGVAVLPAGMSQERFDWLDRWVADPADIIRTPGSESNVKEIYDACNALALDPANFVLNQFCEFGNHLAHYEVTGRALERVFEAVAARRPGLRLAAFVSATGSAGTIAAGDALKERHGTRIVAVEALECPTMLENGFGEHNIQGIGDKHIPLIHNVMNTDVVCAISDRATDELDVLFNTDAGRTYLAKRHGVDDDAARRARALRAVVDRQRAGRHQDGEAPRPRPRRRRRHRRHRRRRAVRHASGPRPWRRAGPTASARSRRPRCSAATSAPIGTDAMIDCTERDRNRIFNLGYYTWVEQQGTPVDVFEARRSPSFWQGLRRYLDVWDELDRRVQRARRRRRRDHRLPLRGVRGVRCPSPPSARGGARTPPRRIGPTCCAS